MGKLKTIEPLKHAQRYFKKGDLTKEKVEEAIEHCLAIIDANMAKYGERFPWSATKNNAYETFEYVDWTDGFWTGMLWLAYEYTGDDRYFKLAYKNIEVYKRRMDEKLDIAHHDLGFLYSPSVVAAYKLTGDKDARDLALRAAEHLSGRYVEPGGFIQAWGELGHQDSYRLIVDCLLNVPILYWASDESGEAKYREMADHHYQQTILNAVREDASAFHTFFFDSQTGEPLYGKTRQGYSDDSSWARGQAWLIYGLALNQSYNQHSQEADDTLHNFKAVTNYFLNRLPQDLVAFWDLIFTDGDNQSRDSSSTAIAVCGINEMLKYMPETDEYKEVYRKASHALLASLIDDYMTKEVYAAAPLLKHGVYSWHSGKGVDEGNIWGDYYFFEALIRFHKNWKMYW